MNQFALIVLRAPFVLVFYFAACVAIMSAFVCIAILTSDTAARQPRLHKLRLYTAFIGAQDVKVKELWERIKFRGQIRKLASISTRGAR